MTKIAVTGTGYVGLSNAALLAQHNELGALDINEEKVYQINQKHFPIEDTEIQDFLENRDLRLNATTSKKLPTPMPMPSLSLLQRLPTTTSKPTTSIPAQSIRSFATSWISTRMLS